MSRDCAMHEDAEIELSMEAAQERKADSLSSSSFECAVDEYRSRAGGLFETCHCCTDDITCGEHLAKSLDRAAKWMAIGWIMKPELLSPDDSEFLAAAFQLENDIHYKEYTFVGTGGNSDEGPEFDEEERWESSEETDIRDAICEAAKAFCIAAGSTAKEIDAKREQALFAKCLLRIEMNCMGGGYENEVGGMGRKEAELVVGWILSATASLWAQIRIQGELMARQSSALSQTKTPEQRRWNALVVKSYSGTVSIAELIELKSMREGHGEDEREAAESSASADGGASDAALGVPVELGEWSKSVVNSVDWNTRTIVFKGVRGKDGAKFSVPRTSNGAWDVLRRLLESQDPQGWTALPENLRKTWKQQFYRAKENPDLLALRRHIYSNNKPGQRGTPKIRLERRERKTLQR